MREIILYDGAGEKVWSLGRHQKARRHWKVGSFEEAEMAKLSATPKTKVEKLCELDKVIRNETPEDKLENEIKQADLFIERIRLQLIELEGAIKNVTSTKSEAMGGSPPPQPLPRSSPSRSASRGSRSSSSSSSRSTPGSSTHFADANDWGEVTQAVIQRCRKQKLSGGAKVNIINIYIILLCITQKIWGAMAPWPPPFLRLWSLKHFRGDETAWPTFWDSFESAVHENPTISDIDKFNYLVSLLDPQASSAIAGLKITAANYPEAVALLKKRFGNKQHIISKHMDTLLALEMINSSQNLKGLRHLYDVVEAQVRGLKALGVSPDSYGTLLSSVFLSKLSHDLRLHIARESTDEELSQLEKLLEITEADIKAREKAGCSVVPAKTKVKPPAPTGHALPAMSGPTPCCYCQGAHLPEECGKVIAVESRRESLRKGGRCFVCLRRGHRIRECRASVRCSHCNGRHHRSLCHRRNDTLSEGSSAVAPNNTISNLDPHAPVFPAGTSVNLSNIDKPVLLQTALAKLFNPCDPQYHLVVRVLFDTGSQRSYITNRVKDELSLEEKAEQRLMLRTFGNSGGKEEHCSVVEVGIFTGDCSVYLELLSVPLICPDLTNQPVSRCRKTYQHLAHLKLADTTDDASARVDVLIGADYYYEFVTGKLHLVVARATL